MASPVASQALHLSFINLASASGYTVFVRMQVAPLFTLKIFIAISLLK